jgi:hypothetical protein
VVFAKTNNTKPIISIVGNPTSNIRFPLNMLLEPLAEDISLAAPGKNLTISFLNPGANYITSIDLIVSV